MKAKLLLLLLLATCALVIAFGGGAFGDWNTSIDELNRLEWEGRLDDRLDSYINNQPTFEYKGNCND